MNIFFNISHPAHVHLFKNAMRLLGHKGHRIVIGARNKEFTLQLLNAYGMDHIVLTNKGQGVLGLLKELIVQQVKLSKIIKKYSIDIMVQVSGIFNAPVGRLIGIPTIAFSDTENDILANAVSFSLSRQVISPSCFDTKVGGVWKNQIFYDGYHELAYLSPKYFKTNIIPENKFLLRFVGWAAGHDIGEKSLTETQKIQLVNLLKDKGEVFISSEAPLPDKIKHYKYRIDPSEIHDFMATCSMVVGESATMASEAACMGIPAIFISDTGRGYTTEQDKRYGLVKHYRLSQWPEVISTIRNWLEKDLFNEWQIKRKNMLKDKLEVTDWIVKLIESYSK